MSVQSLHGLWSVAYKEFLHIARDWRILVLLITFPPVFTLMIGHAFEVGSLRDVPTILRDEDQSPESKALVEFLTGPHTEEESDAIMDVEPGEDPKTKRRAFEWQPVFKWQVQEA